MALPPGLSVHDWDSPERIVPEPLATENGAFTELRLAPNPAAAVFGLMARRREGSNQSVWQVLRDAQGAAIYRVDAAGIRIKDRHTDSRLAGGVVELRKQGEYARQRLDLAAEDRELVSAGGAGSLEDDTSDERMSEEWATLDAYFNESVAAVQVPDDSDGHTIPAGWVLVGSIPRLRALTNDGVLTLSYIGKQRISLMDLLKMRDVAGCRAGGRFAYFVLREMAHDLFSIRRKHGLKDWLKFATALLGALSGAGSLAWLLSSLIPH